MLQSGTHCPIAATLQTLPQPFATPSAKDGMSTARWEALTRDLAETILLKLTPKERWVPAAAADRTAQASSAG
jgi:hypothetical protein